MRGKRDSERDAMPLKQRGQRRKIGVAGPARGEGRKAKSSSVPAAQQRCRAQISDKLQQAISDKADRIEISEIGAVYTA